MKKLITAAFLMTLVSASYGQELTYLHCIETDSGQNQVTGRVIIINNESKTWDFFYLLYDRLLDSALSDAQVDGRNHFVKGESLYRRIISITSSRYTLGHLTHDNPLQDDYFTRLDRMSGNLYTSYDAFQEVKATCSPIDKVSLENLLQQRIDLRDEMIRANEAKRLF